MINFIEGKNGIRNKVSVSPKVDQAKHSLIGNVLLYISGFVFGLAEFLHLNIILPVEYNW